MKRLQVSPGYCPDDKDVFDFFEATHPSKDNVKHFLASCGIMVSSRASSKTRNRIAADADLDWERYCALADAIPERTSRAKWTDVSYLVSTKAADVRDVVEQLKKELTDSYLIDGTGNKLSIVVNHVVPDFSQTRMLQPVPKRAEIEIQTTKEGIQVRRSVDPKAKEISEKLELLIESKFKDTPQGIEKRFINLKDLKTPESRVQFFFDIMDNLEGMDYEDMWGVVVSRFDQKLTAEEEKKKFGKENKAFKSFIRKADFSGEGLRSNPQISSFLKEGFFVSACTLIAETDNPELGKVVFRCGFTDESDDQIFEYKIVSVQPLDGESPGKTRPPKPHEQSIISTWINSTALKSIKSNAVET
ncbi:MAG: hypothetical protein ABIT37_04260 [Luteolibacter sp.]